MEQVKVQGEFFFRILSRAGTRRDKPAPGPGPGYVAGLVGYHALKRISADVTKGVAPLVGTGSDARIMIVDRADYAAGDIPYVEVMSQLSVLEVRCRKQVATNKELADIAFPPGEPDEGTRGPSVKTGATRLAPLVTAPYVLPALTPDVPPGTGLAGSAADLISPARAEEPAGERPGHLNSNALIAAVAGSLRSEKRFVYVYNFYAMDTTGPQSKLMNMYAGVLDCSSRLAQSRNRLLYFVSKKTENLAALRHRVKNPGLPPGAEEQDPDTGAEIRRETGWIDRANTEILASDAIHAELGTFIRTITHSGAGGQSSKLAQAVFREKIHELGITHLLYLGVLSSGGESVTKQWFWGSGSTSYIGGGVVSYILSRIEGDVLGSDTLPVLYSFEFDPSGQKQSPLKQVRFERPEPRK